MEITNSYSANNQPEVIIHVIESATDNIQMSFIEKRLEELGTTTFVYESHDSDEGQVLISYQGIEEKHEDIGYDVSVVANSTVWDLERTQFAISAAIFLHRHLEHDKSFN